MSLKLEVAAELARAVRDVAGIQDSLDATITNGFVLRDTPGSYSVSTGTAAITTVQTEALVITLGRPQPEADTMQERAVLRLLVMAPPGGLLDVRENDRIEVAGVGTYTVVSVEPQQIGAAPASFICEVRG